MLRLVEVADELGFVDHFRCDLPIFKKIRLTYVKGAKVKQKFRKLRWYHGISRPLVCETFLFRRRKLWITKIL